MPTPEKWKVLEERMNKLGVNARDLEEKFILGSGAGGQKVNKTHSCVQLLYGGLEIKCQEHRSREENRFTARVRLCEDLEEMRAKVKRLREENRQKKLRQNRKPSRRVKAQVLVDKRHQAMKKRLRRNVSRDE